MMMHEPYTSITYLIIFFNGLDRVRLHQLKRERGGGGGEGGQRVSLAERDQVEQQAVTAAAGAQVAGGHVI